MMIKIVIVIAESESINLPIQPLVWAVAFGPCLGGTINIIQDDESYDQFHSNTNKHINYFSGNGTLYGASANILCAGIAEQHGYKISFSNYFK